MTGELGDCLNKMLPLSWRLLAVFERRDLPAPFIPLLSPATNQVCQTTFSVSQENGCPLSEKKETEDEQSLKKRLTLSQCSHRAGTFVLFPLLCGCCANVSGWCLECEPIVVFGLFMSGSDPPGPLDIDILYQWQLRQILSVCQRRWALTPVLSATQEGIDPLIYFLRLLFVLILHGHCRH